MKTSAGGHLPLDGDCGHEQKESQTKHGGSTGAHLVDPTPLRLAMVGRASDKARPTFLDKRDGELFIVAQKRTQRPDGSRRAIAGRAPRPPR